MHHPRAKFCANRSRHCGDMAVFDFFKMAAVRRLGFLKVGHFNCSYPSEGQNASPCQILYRPVEPLPFSIFHDGGRPPSWISYKPVWTTHEVYFGGLCHCAKFGLNRCSSFDNMQVLIFCALSLKMPIQAHFGGALTVKLGKSYIFL